MNAGQSIEDSHQVFLGEHVLYRPHAAKLSGP